MVTCQNLIEEFVSDNSTINEKAAKLFELAEYLEKHVKIVTLEVYSESDAYIIFESLNARGNELSILDLVKTLFLVLQKKKR